MIIASRGLPRILQRPACRRESLGALFLLWSLDWMLCSPLVTVGMCTVIPLSIRPVQFASQGNRVKESCGDEACEEVVVPGGDLAAET